MERVMNLYDLPKELKDLIYEFNPEHREQLKVVLNQFMEVLTLTTRRGVVCDNWECYNLLALNQCYETDIFFETNYFCSYSCMTEGRDRITYYLEMMET